MPVTCCNTASATAISRAVRNPGRSSSARVPVSSAIAASISRMDSKASARPATRVSTPSASARRPNSVNQRGLSGTKNKLTKKASEGIMAEANIHRQLAGPAIESSQFTI